MDGKSYRFLYSQDLSNCKTVLGFALMYKQFLYSQDLSNCKTRMRMQLTAIRFLYSQDLSNCKTHEYVLQKVS